MEMLNRRNFLGGLVAAVAFNRVFGEPRGEPLLRFGFTSDPHLCLMTPPTEKALGKALLEFARRNVDAVVISGDLCDMGTAEEMEMFLRLWEKAFPGNRARDGRPVEKMIAWGNHDYMAASYMRRMTPEQLKAAFPRTMVSEKDYWWRRLTGEPFPGEVFHRKIRGFSFVGAHWGHEEETEAWMKAHADEIDTSKLFFHVEHPHPADTVYGRKDGPKVVRKYLATFSECISLSGHSHLSIEDPKALWQGPFVAMTGSVPGQQVAVFSVYPDRVVIERLNMKPDGAPLSDWVLPRPLSPIPGNPFSH